VSETDRLCLNHRVTPRLYSTCATVCRKASRVKQLDVPRQSLGTRCKKHCFREAVAHVFSTYSSGEKCALECIVSLALSSSRAEMD
ncbi:MAG: hypothetical protein ACWGMZ_12990, partial [Thermoguttaceae bacterium]